MKLWDFLLTVIVGGPSQIYATAESSFVCAYGRSLNFFLANQSTTTTTMSNHLTTPTGTQSEPHTDDSTSAESKEYAELERTSSCLDDGQEIFERYANIVALSEIYCLQYPVLRHTPLRATFVACLEDVSSTEHRARVVAWLATVNGLRTSNVAASHRARFPT